MKKIITTVLLLALSFGVLYAQAPHLISGKKTWTGQPDVYIAEAEGHTYVIAVIGRGIHMVHSEGCRGIHK